MDEKYTKYDFGIIIKAVRRTEIIKENMIRKGKKQITKNEEFRKLHNARKLLDFSFSFYFLIFFIH